MENPGSETKRSWEVDVCNRLLVVKGNVEGVVTGRMGTGVGIGCGGGLGGGGGTAGVIADVDAGMPCRGAAVAGATASGT